MSESTNIIDAVSHLYHDLSKHGFGEPAVIDAPGQTCLVWRMDPIAIEVELDWRDQLATLLIVRLEDGQMPDGYYVSAKDGQPCRVHLGQLARKKGWPMPPSTNIDSSVHPMLRVAQSNKLLLDAVLDRIIDERNSLFDREL